MKILVLDTETLGLNDRRVYDLGYVIYDTEAKKVCVMRDYIIKQVYDNPRLMATAYYGNKRPIYEERLHTRYCKKVWWGTACRILATRSSLITRALTTAPFLPLAKSMERR